LVESEALRALPGLVPDTIYISPEHKEDAVRELRRDREQILSAAPGIEEDTQ